MKLKTALITAITASVILTLGNTSLMANAMSVTNQKKAALGKVNLKHFKTVRNTDHTKRSYYYKYIPEYLKNPFETQPNQILGSNNRKLAFKTYLFLPGGSGHIHHYNNPQAVTVTPDGHYAFVAYNTSINGKTGWIARYDLQKLQQLGVTSSNMDTLRRVFSPHHHSYPMTDLEQQVKNATQVGPKFRMGHGQSLSYNPKTHQLWILGIGPGAQNYANAQRINIHSLKPVHKINFKFSKQGYALNDVLTFDKHGNAYSYICSYGGKHNQLKRGIIKIYKGHISDNRVQFSLFKQGILHAPGYITQSMSYNSLNNRIYFVSDGSILSVPVNKLGHLKKNQVKWNGFNTRREFEGLSFDKTGRSYLLVNRGVELLSTDQKW